MLSILSQFRNFKNRPDWDGRKNLNHSFLQFSLSAKKFNLKFRSIPQNESLEIPEVGSMSRRSIRRNYGGLWTQNTPNELPYLCTSPRWLLTQKMAKFTHFGQEIYSIKTKSCGMNAESDLSLEKKDIASCYVLSNLSQFRSFKNRPDWDGRKNLNHSFLQFSLSAKKFNLKFRSIPQN